MSSSSPSPPPVPTPPFSSSAIPSFLSSFLSLPSSSIASAAQPLWPAINALAEQQQNMAIMLEQLSALPISSYSLFFSLSLSLCHSFSSPVRVAPLNAAWRFSITAISKAKEGINKKGSNDTEREEALNRAASSIASELFSCLFSHFSSFSFSLLADPGAAANAAKLQRFYLLRMLALAKEFPSTLATARSPSFSSPCSSSFLLICYSLSVRAALETRRITTLTGKTINNNGQQDKAGADASNKQKSSDALCDEYFSLIFPVVSALLMKLITGPQGERMINEITNSNIDTAMCSLPTDHVLSSSLSPSLFAVAVRCYCLCSALGEAAPSAFVSHALIPTMAEVLDEAAPYFLSDPTAYAILIPPLVSLFRSFLFTSSSPGPRHGQSLLLIMAVDPRTIVRNIFQHVQMELIRQAHAESAKSGQPGDGGYPGVLFQFLVSALADPSAAAPGNAGQTQPLTLQRIYFIDLYSQLYPYLFPPQLNSFFDFLVICSPAAAAAPAPFTMAVQAAVWARCAPLFQATPPTLPASDYVCLLSTSLSSCLSLFHGALTAPSPSLSHTEAAAAQSVASVSDALEAAAAIMGQAALARIMGPSKQELSNIRDSLCQPLFLFIKAASASSGHGDTQANYFLSSLSSSPPLLRGRFYSLILSLLGCPIVVRFMAPAEAAAVLAFVGRTLRAQETNTHNAIPGVALAACDFLRSFIPFNPSNPTNAMKNSLAALLADIFHTLFRLVLAAPQPSAPYGPGPGLPGPSIPSPFCASYDLAVLLDTFYAFISGQRACDDAGAGLLMPPEPAVGVVERFMVERAEGEAAAAARAEREEAAAEAAKELQGAALVLLAAAAEHGKAINKVNGKVFPYPTITIPGPGPAYSCTPSVSPAAVPSSADGPAILLNDIERLMNRLIGELSASEGANANGVHVSGLSGPMRRIQAMWRDIERKVNQSNIQ